MKKILAAVAVSTLVSSATQAIVIHGAINSGSGQFIDLSVPYSQAGSNHTVGKNNFDDLNVYVFNEAQDIEITQALDVDYLVSSSQSGSIAAGTELSSHYVIYDPKRSERVNATIQFDANILAVITSRDTLFSSNYLGLDTVTYLNPEAIGLENKSDKFNLTQSDTLFINFKASSPGDIIRVITDSSAASSEVPLPAAAWLFGSALVGLAGLRNRK